MNEIGFWKMAVHSGTAMAHTGIAERISELETLFEINRDNTKIRQMNKDVEAYEQARLDSSKRRR